LLAGVAASWYFGNNAAAVATYDPATGVTIDGIAGDGGVNRNPVPSRPFIALQLAALGLDNLASCCARPPSPPAPAGNVRRHRGPASTAVGVNGSTRHRKLRLTPPSPAIPSIVTPVAGS